MAMKPLPRYRAPLSGIQRGAVDAAAGGGLRWGVEGFAICALPAGWARALRPLSNLILWGDPSDSPRGGPSTWLRMYCAPTAPAGVVRRLVIPSPWPSHPGRGDFEPRVSWLCF
jgi:hypothetical protein